MNDEETLLRYYIRSGGAANFAKRFIEAMGRENRWYCSEFYGREITDPEILWDYYVSRAANKTISAELSMSC